MQRNLRVGSCVPVPCPAAGVKCCHGRKSFAWCLFSTGPFRWCFPAGSHVLTVWEQDGQRVCSLQGRCCSASAGQGIPTGTSPLSWCQPLACTENTRTSVVYFGEGEDKGARLLSFGSTGSRAGAETGAALSQELARTSAGQESRLQFCSCCETLATLSFSFYSASPPRPPRLFFHFKRSLFGL